MSAGKMIILVGLSVTVAAAAFLMFRGESPQEEKKPTNPGIGGFDSPEQVFEHYVNDIDKEDPTSILLLIPPKERAFYAFGQFAMVRFFMSFLEMAPKEELEKTDIAKDFKAIIKKHDLGERLSFAGTDDPDKLEEVANRVFEGVDLAEFLRDINAFQKKHLDLDKVKSPQANAGLTEREAESKAEEKTSEDLELRNMKIEGDQAIGTVVEADDESHSMIFVKVDGRWFFSFLETQRAAELNAKVHEFHIETPSVEVDLVITFDTPADFQRADRKMLMSGLNIDKDQEVRLEKDDSSQRVHLSFWAPVKQVDEAKQRIANADGVNEAEYAWQVELREKVLQITGTKLDAYEGKTINQWIDGLKSNETRKASADALVQIGLTAIPALIAYLKDVEHQNEALDFMTSEGQRTHGQNRNIAREVKSTIVRFGPEVVPVLIEALKYRDKTAMSDIADILGQLGPDAADAALPIAQLLILPNANHDISFVFRAGYALGKMGPNAVPALVKILESDDEKLWSFAANAMNEIGPAAEAAGPALIRVMKKTDDEMALFSETKALGAVFQSETSGNLSPGANDAVSVLMELLERDSVLVRVAAAGALTQIDRSTREAMLPILISGIKEGEQHILFNTLPYLNKLGPDAAPAVSALIEALDDENSLNVQAVIGTLGKIGPEAKAAVSALKTISEGANSSSYEAQQALELITGEKYSSPKAVISARPEISRRPANPSTSIPARDSSPAGNSRNATGYGERTNSELSPLAGAQLQPPLAIAPFDSEKAKQHQQAWADFLGVPTEKQFILGKNQRGEDVKLTMVLVPPGEFLMGSTDEEQAKFMEEAKAAEDQWAIDRIPSEGPQHRVRITRPFYLGKYEVTQPQWESVMGNNPSQFKDSPSHPVEQVNWDDIQSFLAKLNDSGEADQMKFSLPTEAQWEYACRSGTTTAYYGGTGENDLRQYGWCTANSGGKTHPVGQLRRNAFGLYDMHGNVWEWCADWFAADYYAKSPEDDPTQLSARSFRVLRGGCWIDPPRNCRSAYRSNRSPGGRFNHLGFRLASELPDNVVRAKFPAIASNPATVIERPRRLLPILKASASSQMTEPYNGRPQTAERLLEYDNLSTFWNSLERVNQATITFQLKERASVYDATIRWKYRDGTTGARALKYVVETSLDNKTWQPVYTYDDVDSANTTQAEDTFFFGPTPANLLRITMSNSSYGRNSYFSANWVKLYGDSPSAKLETENRFNAPARTSAFPRPNQTRQLRTVDLTKIGSTVPAGWALAFDGQSARVTAPAQ